VIDAAVKRALALNRPVVALESTIVAHGMPFPENFNLCLQVETILRNAGVEPATIAVKNGVCRIGLHRDELEELARAGPRAVKCSTRELPLVLAKQHSMTQATTATTTDSAQWGATTVASTMTLAHLAGISVFVTGGIGGVHRNGHLTMDVSADLMELARTPVIVVSAGIKSILDIGRTLEVLETNGVPTVAYQTDEYPAFFSPKSGCKAPARVDTAKEVALAYWAARDLQISSGMLVAVPNDDPSGGNVEEAIQAALIEADALGVRGRDVTPFILKQVAEKTAGESLQSNMALVQRNAHVGAAIAVAVADEKKRRYDETIVHSHRSPPRIQVRPSKVIVLGGVVYDLIAKPQDGQSLLLGTSNLSVCTESDGGVGRNIAEVLGRLGCSPILYSAVGNDSRGIAMHERLERELGVQAKSTVQVIHGRNTATYVALLDERGDLYTGCADTSIFSEIVSPSIDILKTAQIIVIDANPPLHVLLETVQRAAQHGVEVFFEPTSVAKARIAAADDSFMSRLACAFPNTDELVAMSLDNQLDGRHVSLEMIKDLAARVLNRMRPDKALLVVTMGEQGVLLATRDGSGATVSPKIQLFPAVSNLKVVNATGAGDSLCGAFVYSYLQGRSITEAIENGVRAAEVSLGSAKTISPNISNCLLETPMIEL
jgi:pseudouridine-5'-phosphate glycosidase/sugar/nucleoside kinase (ribokinase family)